MGIKPNLNGEYISMGEKVKRKEKIIFISLCIAAVFVTGIVFSAVYGKSIKSESVQAGENADIFISSKEITLENNIYSSVNSDTELRGVWISFLEFYKGSYTEKEFKERIDTMFDQCVSHKINTVFVHVRPCADAFYNSAYFPWSKQLTGVMGKNPGYDPLKYMVKAAHSRKLKIHAWINPYRVTSSGTDISSYPASHPAKVWKNSKNASDKRNVLAYEGKLYFNPAKAEVRKLIVNGAKEIVKNYDVDGIHFDDYFYPNLGTNYKKNYDAKEYKAYKKTKKAKKQSYLSIEDWRRQNVNLLLKEVYAAVKKENSSVLFGVSPAGELNNLYSNCYLYCDVKKWMSSTGYIDYICPQIYWSFEHPTAAFDKIAEQWNKIPRNKKVKLYIGLAAYRAGISKSEAKSINDPGWAKSKSVLNKEVTYIHNNTSASGWVLYRYDNMVSSKAKKEIDNLLKLYN